jgi:small subunit ribosomal protein S15
MAISAEVKTKTVGAYRRHDKDSGSPEVQIALLTEKITALADHLKDHGKDHHSRRGLVMMVGKRNRLLRYLADVNHDQYTSVIGRLGLRK